MQPDMAQLLRLVRSPEGQQLLALLQKKDPQTLRTAAAQAGSGDTARAGHTLASVLQDPEVRHLLEKMGGSL